MTRKRLARIGVVAGTVAALVGGGYALAAETTVELTATGPQPDNATVDWGGTVTFHNANTVPVTVTSGSPDFSSPAIPSGGTYVKVFNGKTGRYVYRVAGTKPDTRGAIRVVINGTLTLVGKPSAVPYGKRVTLTGKTTFFGSPIAIQQLIAAQDQKGWVDVAQINAAADGSFTYTAKPLRKTQYRAATANSQLASNDVTIGVLPRVTITTRKHRVTVGKTITFKATVSPPSSATGIQLVRASGGVWRKIATSKTNTEGQTTLKWKVTVGKSLIRAEVKRPVLASGFEASHSAPVSIAGVNPPTTIEFRVVAPRVNPKLKHQHVGPDHFSSRFLRTSPGQVTIVMRNLGNTRHGLAISGKGLLLKGKIVGKGGVSKVTATLKPGLYVFYSYVRGDVQNGQKGKLLVA